MDGESGIARNVENDSIQSQPLKRGRKKTKMNSKNTASALLLSGIRMKYRKTMDSIGRELGVCRSSVYGILSHRITPSDELAEKIYSMALQVLGEQELLEAMTGKYLNQERGKGTQRWRGQ